MYVTTPYIIYCYFYSDGCAHTGTFIAICYALDRLNIEGTVDIFHTVKSSRICRAGLVSTLVSTLVLYSCNII